MNTILIIKMFSSSSYLHTILMRPQDADNRLIDPVSILRKHKYTHMHTPRERTARVCASRACARRARVRVARTHVSTHKHTHTHAHTKARTMNVFGERYARARAYFSPNTFIMRDFVCACVCVCVLTCVRATRTLARFVPAVYE